MCACPAACALRSGAAPPKPPPLAPLCAPSSQPEGGSKTANTLFFSGPALIPLLNFLPAIPSVAKLAHAVHRLTQIQFRGPRYRQAENPLFYSRSKRATRRAALLLFQGLSSFPATQIDKSRLRGTAATGRSMQAEDVFQRLRIQHVVRPASQRFAVGLLQALLHFRRQRPETMRQLARQHVPEALQPPLLQSSL